MGADQNIDWASAAASAIDWWRTAGVDVLVEDTSFAWLDAPAPALVVAPASTALAPSPALPADLAGFLVWRQGESAPEAAWGGSAFVATGPADAELMVMVDCPERDDRVTLMDGAAGRLLDAMLNAIGHARSAVQVASVCQRRPTTGRIPRETEARLGEIARHHVALSGASRLLVLGDAASRAILKTNATDARGRWHALNHGNGTVTHVVASHHPRLLLDRWALKAEAWRDLSMFAKGPQA